MTPSDVQRAVRIAHSILEGSTPLFLGCRQIARPLHRLGLNSEEPFVTLLGVDSELDVFPVQPEERQFWSERSLAVSDAQLAEWQPDVEPFIFDACREVIRRFDHAEETGLAVVSAKH